MEGFQWEKVCLGQLEVDTCGADFGQKCGMRTPKARGAANSPRDPRVGFHIKSKENTSAIVPFHKYEWY